MTEDDDIRAMDALCLAIRKVLDRHPRHIVTELMVELGVENWEEWFPPRSKGAEPADLVYLLANYETRAPLTKEQFLSGWAEAGYYYATNYSSGYWRNADTIRKYLQKAQGEAKKDPTFRRAVDDEVRLLQRRRRKRLVKPGVP